ncbi:MAG: RsmB/NOP family class I SAM-dependent RNA methyltransferase [Oscillospiraceae bacterium]|nr:RsmB/NOP family class I SAM-dependent RNA methyltransferase [Oscillospiraceae bacterium]
MLPEAFLQKMKTLLGTEFDEFLCACDRPLQTGLRRNPLKSCTASLDRFGLSPVPWEATGFYYDASTRPGLSALHDAGVYYLQEPSAMAPAALLDAKPGERVLDLCAAPGGKSTQIAAALAGEGLLVCNEIHPKRARILSSNIERLGIANALVLNEHPAKLAERFAGYFDKILVDAPCSGEGMFRKEAAAVTDWSQETVEMCAKRQQEILQSASVMLRKGGRLVYSTCTFSPEENEGTVAEFLRKHPDYSIEAVDAPWFCAGRCEWADEAMLDLRRTFRLWPHKLRGEGHFAAVLHRNGEEAAQDVPCEPTCKMPAELASFIQETNAALPDGGLIAFGDTLCLVPHGFPSVQRLKVLRAGLELGQSRKGRFEPAHAWALWLSDLKNTYDLTDEEARQYLSGQVLASEKSGWTLMRMDGASLGWAKGSAGQLKNHYPKGLRHP